MEKSGTEMCLENVKASAVDDKSTFFVICATCWRIILESIKTPDQDPVIAALIIFQGKRRAQSFFQPHRVVWVDKKTKTCSPISRPFTQLAND